jgi:hypothetical protein
MRGYLRHYITIPGLLSCQGQRCFYRYNVQNVPGGPPSSVCTAGSIAVGLNRPELETDRPQGKKIVELCPILFKCFYGAVVMHRGRFYRCSSGDLSEEILPRSPHDRALAGCSE